jgi:hypothetical protein
MLRRGVTGPGWLKLIYVESGVGQVTGSERFSQSLLIDNPTAARIHPIRALVHQRQLGFPDQVMGAWSQSERALLQTTEGLNQDLLDDASLVNGSDFLFETVLVEDQLFVVEA